MIDWRNLDLLPSGVAGEWVGRRPYRRDIRGKAAVERVVAHWTPIDPLIISEPDSMRFAPVLSIDRYRKKVHQKIIRKQIVILLVFLGVVCMIGLSWFVKPRPQALMATLAALSMFLFWAIDYWLVIRNIDALFERALFSYWILKTGLFDFVIWVGIMLASASAQLGGQKILGGLDPLLLKYGLVYDYVKKGQLWRLFIGPFFHASIAHWGANLSILMFLGPIASWISRRSAFCVFICGSAIGAITSMINQQTDAYVGVSAGIFAMMGYCSGVAFKYPQKFPLRFAYTAITFSLLSLVLPWLLDPNLNGIAHLSGLVFGICYGLCIYSNPITSEKV
jgi:membrane associated rhomboid family serine protease